MLQWKVLWPYKRKLDLDGKPHYVLVRPRSSLIKRLQCNTHTSAVKETDDPAATETVSVADPLAPPTLHRRSFDPKSDMISTVM